MPKKRKQKPENKRVLARKRKENAAEFKALVELYKNTKKLKAEGRIL